MKYWILGSICFLTGIIVATYGLTKFINKVLNEQEKIRSYYNILNYWFLKFRKGENIVTYFRHNGYKNIAIYGFKELGIQLLKELEKTEVNVRGIIDKDENIDGQGLDIFRPGDELPELDVVVVTASYYFEEVKDSLKYIKCDIVPINDVIYFE